MADNIAVTPGTGETIAFDDVSGVKYQRVKLDVGGDGASSPVESIAKETGGNLDTIAGDTTSIDNKLPALGQALAADSIPVILPAATIATLTPPAAITGFATAAKQDTIIAAVDGVETSLTSLDGKVTACNTGAVTVAASALPTGASTAANQATIIGHVDGIETLLGTIDGDTGLIATDASTIAGDTTSIDNKITACNTGAVTVAASALPTGASTAANQTTLIGHVDGIETLLGTIDADTSALAGAVAGNEVQVDVVGSLPAGTNAIGKLAANSGVDIGDVDVTSLPALASGTNLIGKASTAADTSTIYNGTTALTPKYAFANINASTTDGNIVTAVTSKKIRVLSFRIHTAGTATNVTFNSKPAGAGTAITELFACAANGGRAENYNPVGHFETAAGEGLTVTTGTGSTTGIGVTYVEI